jgi:hypothetical protein
MTDPFDVVKDEVQESLRVAMALYQRHQQLINGGLATSAEQDELSWTRDQLDTQLKQLDYDVQDLEDTVAIVEKNPTKYTHIDSLEIQARKLFIEQTKKELRNIKNSIYSKQAAAKIQKKQREQLLPSQKQGGLDISSKIDNAYTRDNQEFMNQEFVKQNSVISEQDKLAEKAAESVDRIKQVAVDMGDELTRHHKLLGGLEGEVSTTGNMLGRARKRIDNFLKSNNDKPKIVIIIILVVIIFLLILGIVAVDMI